MKHFIIAAVATTSLVSIAEDTKDTELMSMLPSEGAVSLFDTETLTGWKTSKFDKKFWSVKDGEIQGGNLTTNVPTNVWLVSEKEYSGQKSSHWI